MFNGLQSSSTPQGLQSRLHCEINDITPDGDHVRGEERLTPLPLEVDLKSEKMGAFLITISPFPTPAFAGRRRDKARLAVLLGQERKEPTSPYITLEPITAFSGYLAKLTASSSEPWVAVAMSSASFGEPASHGNLAVPVASSSELTVAGLAAAWLLGTPVQGMARCGEVLASCRAETSHTRLGRLATHGSASSGYLRRGGAVARRPLNAVYMSPYITLEPMNPIPHYLG
ncbi:hypothetical protein B0H13DRAFT_1850354 [Mycena leptocephala]|nr:hypothetical protein B0H13DRAFT_1850354 [Mycena leptocephala]